jgi:hypothetical protein
VIAADLLGLRTGKSSIGRHLLQRHVPLELPLQTPLQENLIVGRIRRHLHVGDQLHLRLRIARLTHPYDIPTWILLSTLPPIGRIRVVRGLQALGTDLLGL